MFSDADDPILSAFFGVFVYTESHSQILAEKRGKEKATITGGRFLISPPYTPMPSFVPLDQRQLS